MSFHLSATSLAKLMGIHPDLVRVVKRAITITTIEFKVGEGLRTLAKQKQNIKDGVSWTLKSRHLTGHAVDLWPMIGGKVTWAWPVYYKLAPIVKEAARLEKVPIVWGGDWKRNKDGPHFELDRKQYP